MTTEKKSYTHRYVAQVDIETTTPLAVGSGEKDIMTDSTIAKDVNGLPYIPGTALAGILRNSIEEKEKADIWFGTHKNKGTGSLILFSSAHIIDSNGLVIEGLFDGKKSDYLKHFDHLPIRQHASIDPKGVTMPGGKFDEEVVFKGTRFRFEIELLAEASNTEKDTLFSNLLKELCSSTLRIGSGTRNGFGELKVVNLACKHYDLTKDLNDYLNKSASLNDQIKDDGKISITTTEKTGWITYMLSLQPEDFFLFGSGFGDDDGDVDMTPVAEKFYDWSKKEFIEDTILIPATSVKGALSHRVAYHYNYLNDYKIRKNGDQYRKDPAAKTGIENKAIKVLFGYTIPGTKEARRGHVIFSDIIKQKDKETSKVLNHVAIDRFTGGAIDGALFSEKVIYGNDNRYTLYIKVNPDAVKENDDNIFLALEKALKDIASGMLPLGGGVNRGHGCFTGELFRDNELIYKYENDNNNE